MLIQSFNMWSTIEGETQMAEVQRIFNEAEDYNTAIQKIREYLHDKHLFIKQEPIHPNVFPSSLIMEEDYDVYIDEVSHLIILYNERLGQSWDFFYTHGMEVLDEHGEHVGRPTEMVVDATGPEAPSMAEVDEGFYQRFFDEIDGFLRLDC